MAGDISRSTFLQPKHYSGVRMQQGRVMMDADWNEQLDIRSYIEQTTNIDVIGYCGVPEGDPGFGITVQGGNLLISKGRGYVDGILCENDQDVLIALPSPAGATPDQPDLPGVDFTTAAGIFFSPLLTTLGGGPGFSLPPQNGIYVAYLDVWERDITALEDPSIREVALGGPDTCTRTKTVWQVKLLRLGDLTFTPTCTVAWNSYIQPSTGQMEAQAKPDPGNNNPCSVPAQAGYRSLENQLYRVEIHQGGAAGTATFKWSRENASVVASWVGTDPANSNNLVVSTLGKDQVLGFAGGQWVELTDDTRELWGIPGTLVQLTNAQMTSLGPTLTINVPPGTINFSDYPVNPKIRRWDEINTAAITLNSGAVPLTENTWIDLENGVQVFFVTGGYYNTGDYWLIPARTTTAISAPMVEWPTDNSTPPNPLPQAAAGIAHHYCSLASLQYNNGWTVLTDCRSQFPPLTGITSTGADKGIHVTGVNLGSEPLPNDSLVPITTLEKEQAIRVFCDAPVFPASVQQATCFLSVDHPYPLDLFTQTPIPIVLGFHTLILPGTVSTLSTTTASGTVNEIDLRLSTRFLVVYLTYLLFYMLENNLGYRLLARLTLKGDFIWGLNDSTLYLDGDVFGIARQDPDGTHTSLQFPSGDGKRGGDFGMWFWLGYAAGRLGVVFQQSSVSGANASATAYVILTSPAPTGGATIALSNQSLDQNGKPLPAPIGTMPASVTIGAGLTSTTFTITQITLPPNVTSASIQVTATYGNVTGQATVSVTSPSASPGGPTTVINPVTVAGGLRTTAKPIRAVDVGGLL